MAMNHREGISRRTESILDEVQTGLFEIAGARDFLADGGDLSKGKRRVEEALQRIQRAMAGLRRDTMGLLMGLGDAEGGSETDLMELRSRARLLTELVEPQGMLDLMLDQLDDFRETAGREGEWLRQDVRADLMDTRAHLHEVHQNYRRITGRSVIS